MKGLPLWRRFGFALEGVAHAIRCERSFQVQILAALCVAVALLWLQPPLLWVALLVALVALVLALELFNTALEELLDGLHPARAEFVRRAKNCAAGAVLMLSVGAVAVFVLMIMDTGFRRY